MSSDRLRQKSELHFKLGRLFGPLLELIEYHDRYDEQQKAEILARYFAEFQSLMVEFEAFCRGQPGHDYAIQSIKFVNALVSVRSGLVRGESLPDTVRPGLAIAQAAIDAIPVPRTSIILEAGSPFTAYCKLRELSEVDATKAITWLDPYMGASIFHRYISGVRPAVPVTLVTCEPGINANKRDKQRWTEFLDTSRLYAGERGPALYRLVVQPQLHDRWVVFDEKRIYGLGGSVKDAGAKDYFTISGVEASPENLRRIQDHIDTGIEWFGPSANVHL